MSAQVIVFPRTFKSPLDRDVDRLVAMIEGALATPPDALGPQSDDSLESRRVEAMRCRVATHSDEALRNMAQQVGPASARRVIDSLAPAAVLS